MRSAGGVHWVPHTRFVTELPGERAPLRRFETRAGCVAVVADDRAASHEVRCSSGSCMRSAGGVHWVPHTRFVLVVSAGTIGFRRSPSAARFRNRLHPLVSFTPLQSSPSSHPPTVSLPPAPSLGFAVPHRGVTDRRPCPGAPSPRCLSVRSVSHAHDGFLRLPACGFISPHNHVQGLLYRGFPSRSATSTRRR